MVSLLLKLVPLLYHLVAFLGPRYGLNSSNYSSLDKFTELDSFYELCASWGGSHTMLAL